ncbi:hypothetical protein [Saccharibacillus sp. O23]|uniref:hypothetical protein n=1 Tax=Saccharibacillus sp. O23 TaxID=2009338 RepID=UPI00117BB9B2|nr:hypothetical protein [Saccharibacillus sp. O23]
MKTKTVGMMIGLILIVAFISFYTFPKEIVRVQKAAILMEDGSIRDTTINIVGTLERPVFKPSKFSGEFTIEDIKATEENTLLDLNVVQKKNGINMANWVYHSSNQPLELKMPGIIWFDKDFGNISIQSTNQWLEKSGDNDLQPIKIISPAVSFEQAAAVQAELANRFGSPLEPLQKE